MAGRVGEGISTKHDRLMREFFPFSIGLDSVFNRLAGISESGSFNFPPYNIIRDEAKTVLEMALAGYRKEDVSVVVEDGILSITGDNNRDDEKDSNHVHHGIATRRFVRKFTLGEYIEVNCAEMKDGMLIVELEEVLPPEKQPKNIEIK